jgi:membrane dipeptidase
MNLNYIDLHNDYVLSQYEAGEKLGTAGQISDALLKEANCRLFFSGFSYDDALGDTDRQFSILLQCLKQKQLFELVTDQQSLKHSLSGKKTGMLLHLEGAGIVGRSLKRFQYYVEQGVRSVGLTHGDKTSLASGNKSDPEESISVFGKSVIKYCETKGIIVDMAHINRKGFFEYADSTTKPIFVSHGNARAVCDDPRNYSDEQLKALKESGGVIGIFFSQKYVKQAKSVTLDDVADHFSYIADKFGTKILAVGSDFGGITTGLPKGLSNILDLQILFGKLAKRGFTPKELQDIAFNNPLRVIRQHLL